MSIEVSLLIAALVFFTLVGLGVPIAFALGGTAVGLTALLWEAAALHMVAATMWSMINSFVLLAIPLFIFMGNVLMYSGIAEDLFDMMYKWFGGLRGGLAVGTIIICTLFAAMTGIVGAAIVTMGLIALPAMLKHQYNKHLACGSIAAGGGLGILIPPSVPFIIYGLVGGVSVGKLFAGGLTSGLVISALFLLYVGIRCAFRRELAPALPVTERLSLREKLAATRFVALPAFIILAVLGAIFSGIATPTEAAAIGSVATLASAVFVQRKFTWANLKDTCNSTLSVTAMVMWVVIGGMCFKTLLTGLGAEKLMTETVAALAVSPWVMLAGMLAIVLFLGTMVDATAIIMICVPFFVPLATTLGFDPIWFGVVFMIATLIGYSTPPFAANLFYLRGVAPKEITMGDLYVSVFPFIGLMLLALALCIIFPQLIVWLPNTLFK